MVRDACADAPGWGDFGAVAMVLWLRHVACVQDDPLFRCFCEV